VFIYLIYEAFKAKRLAGDNPWGPGATTLEWTVSSPPPFHQFVTPPRLPGDDEMAEHLIVGHGRVG
jgi:cytochrome c oxidase subunit I